MIKLNLETSSMGAGHSVRGIGMYTRSLQNELKKNPNIEFVDKNEAQITHYPYFDLFFDTLPLNHKSKTVVTVHDVIPLKFPEYYKAGIKGSLRFQKQKLAIRKVDAVITDSVASKNDIVEFLGVKEEKIHVVYLAAHQDMQKQSEYMTNLVRRKYEIPPKYVLYVGDINYNKNIPQLIKMMKFLDKDISLVCVGRNFTPQNIPEWQWIEAQIAMSDVADRVFFLNNILGDSFQEISSLYSGALCYVQPSLAEGFGLPVLEAMQCQTPVICAHNSSLIEVGGSNVLFREPKAEDLADGVEEVFYWSKNRRLKHVRAALNWSKNFSWQKTAEETIKIYEAII